MDTDIIEELAYEQILAELKEDFARLWLNYQQQEEWRNVLTLESEPVTKLLELLAYVQLAYRARINDAARANLLAFAAANDLDRLAEFYGLTRSPGESDEKFRARVRSRIAASSTAGPRAHYRHHALAADPAVADVHVDSPRPGLVRIAVATADGSPPANSLLATVADHINQDHIRVLTDTVDVVAARSRPFRVSATIYLLPEASQGLMDGLPARLQALDLGLGRDVSRSQIIAALHVPGVQRVDLSEPAADLIIGADEQAQLGQVNLSYGGRNY